MYALFLRYKNFVAIWLFWLVSFFVLLQASCKPLARETKLAEVNGVAINERQVDAANARKLLMLQRQIYEIRRDTIDQWINDSLLKQEADRRGMSVATLLENEVESSIPPMSESEIKAFYESNKVRVPVPFEQVKAQLQAFLLKQRSDAKRNLYLQTLREKSKIVRYLKPPPVLRTDINVLDAPSKGKDSTPVTIVKFEDFQCPFCKQAQPILGEILTRYNGKVRVVHKDLPLDSIHPQARQAAEAARCAGDQGKFWEYHDKLYASSPKAAPEDLRSYAKEVGLNKDSFETCLSSGKFKAVVQKDVNEGAGLGLTGTPAFFINGREITGAQPVEAFAAMIDEELARAK
ncbi:MAG: thioredoxin domain-containing protein [Deltaproteobacteria bacterium]|nr:thioredoxin domain-containing protein [Deltaproteobacteria bacterium]